MPERDATRSWSISEEETQGAQPVIFGEAPFRWSQDGSKSRHPAPKLHFHRSRERITAMPSFFASRR